MHSVTWTRLKSMEYSCRHDPTRVRVWNLWRVRQFESGYGQSCCCRRPSIEVVAASRWEGSSPSLCPADNIRPVNRLRRDRSAPRLTPTKLCRPLPDSDEPSLFGCDLCDLVWVPIWHRRGSICFNLTPTRLDLVRLISDLVSICLWTSSYIVCDSLCRGSLSLSLSLSGWIYVCVCASCIFAGKTRINYTEHPCTSSYLFLLGLITLCTPSLWLYYDFVPFTFNFNIFGVNFRGSKKIKKNIAIKKVNYNKINKKINLLQL